MVGPHNILPDGQHTLMGAILLSKHPVHNRLAVVDKHDVHGAVANVTEHIYAQEVPDLAGHRREALGKHIHPGDLHPVGFSPEGKGQFPVPHEVGFEILPLPAHPGEGQSHCKIYRGVCQAIYIQLTGDSGQGEDIVVIVPGLVRLKLLVACPNQVVASVIDQQIVFEYRLCVVGG